MTPWVVNTGVRHLIAVVFLITAPALYGAKETMPSTVADLRYGVTLYEYYQSNYFAALSELMVAEARGGIKGHSDNPQLIAGSIGLAFGMEQRAGQAFTELLTPMRPEAVRDTAWFYLGKIQYQQGDWAGAEQSFLNISPAVDHRLARELAGMRLQVLLRNDDYKEAKQLYDTLPDMGNWSELINYNMGVSLGRQGDALAAQAYLAKATATPLKTNPVEQKLQRALRDRAYTASGYVHIQQGEYQQAIEQFNRVRLTGPYSDRALLGLGWAYASAKSFEQALSPWQTLSKGSLQQVAVQESLLAVPYAYKALGADVAALAAYESAEQIFTGELAKIEDLRGRLDQGLLLNAIRSAASYKNQSWFALDSSVALQPESAYLSEIFARNDFQSRVQSLRDLLYLQETLTAWQRKQEIYADLLVQRGQLRTQKLAQMEASGQMHQESRLREQAASLAAWLSAVEKNRDYLALISNPDDKDNLAIIDGALENASALAANQASTDAEQGQLAFYRGILLWRAQESFSENLWGLKRNIADLNTQLDQLNQSQASLQKAIEEAPEILPYQQRLDALGQRVATETVALERQLQLEEQTLRKQVMAALDSQQIRVKNYLARARLSIASLYDERLKQE